MSSPPLGTIELDPLLTAIAHVETSSGRNNWPRIERSYLPLGSRWTVQGHIIEGTGANVNEIVRERLQRWGMASAASWGPWQILYHTAADRGYTGPPSGLHEAEVSMTWVIRQLQLIMRRGADTVSQIADAWNSGTHRDHIVPHHYMAQLVRAYDDYIVRAYDDYMRREK